MVDTHRFPLPSGGGHHCCRQTELHLDDSTSWPTRILPVTTRCWRSLAVCCLSRHVVFPCSRDILLTQWLRPGGSFGVVYKGIERTTGETVAIKHVSRPSVPNPFVRPITDRDRHIHRSILSLAKMISRRSSKKSPCSALAPAPLSPSTRRASCAATSYGLSWSIWAAGLVLIWSVALPHILSSPAPY